jgi:DNA topoisomerase I
MSKLFIVESPGKLKKLREILGNDYIVEASIGHILEISEENSNECKNGINMETYLPRYSQCKDKIPQIKKLIALCKKVGKKNVILAPDEDREGTMIGYSLARELGIDYEAQQVVGFNSITSAEIKNAIKNPTKIDMNMLQAQQARSVLDKISGFWVSPILKQCGLYDAKSAGRVQSVVVKIVVERENEIKSFFEKENPTYFYVNCDMNINKDRLLTKLVSMKKSMKISDEEYDPLSDNESQNQKNTKSKSKAQSEITDDDKTYAKIDTEKETIKIIKKMKKAKYEILDVKEKIRKSNPPPPFSTSTLQQFTSTRMNRMSGKETMAIAQKLYEAGHITYMRTDSINISDEASKNIKKYIKDEHGDDYYTKREYKNKKNNTQEAHECIRPTKVDIKDIPGDAKQVKLYEAIWKRTIQSQMSSAEYNDIIIEIKMNEKEKTDSDTSSDSKESILSKYKLVGKLETLTFEGFLVLDGKTPKEKTSSKKFKKADLSWEEINGIENCKKPPVRYNDASLIKKMDPSELNIGRPSTYASIIDKIQVRKYANIEDVEGKKLEMVKLNLKKTNKSEITRDVKDLVIGKEIKKFVPSELGIKVTNFLEENFTTLMDYKFTESMEKNLDKVACGKMKRFDVVETFYKYIAESISKLKVDNKFINNNNSNSGNNAIGTNDGEDILLLNGKFGKFIKHKENSPINLDKLILAHNLKLKEINGDEKYDGSDNKKIAKAYIKELDNPKIVKYDPNTNNLFEWKIKKMKYLLKKSRNDSYYVEEWDDKNNKKMMFSLKFIFSRITRDKDLELSDDNINKICSHVTNSDITETKEYFKNLKK